MAALPNEFMGNGEWGIYCYRCELTAPEELDKSLKGCPSPSSCCTLITFSSRRPFSLLTLAIQTLLLRQFAAHFL